MRNSLFPILMTLAVAVVAVLLIPTGERAGRGGPLIAPGIFRLVKGTRGDIRSMEGLTIDDRVAVQEIRDERIALEPDPWSTVVVAAEDREPVTRSVVLALAEDLTRRGVLVIVDTPEEHDLPPPLPIASDRWLRLRTVSADPIPAMPGDAFHAVVRVRHGASRLPADHPAAGLQWAGGSRETTFTIAHASKLDAVKERAWPRWWAAIGRAIAADALATIEPGVAPGAPLPGDWTDRARPAWPERLPDPPTEDVARWFGCFQHDLVRGWIGRIDGTTTTDEAGKTESSFAPIEHRLAAAKWEATSAEGAALRTWRRERGAEILQFSAVQSGGGFQLACWQEWKQPAGVHDRWLDAAKAGDVAARDQLRRHLRSTALPEDQQAAARALLAQGDLAERAMVGGDRLAAYAESVAGRRAAQIRDGALPTLARGTPLELPIAPDLRVLTAADGHAIDVLLMVRPFVGHPDDVKDEQAKHGTAAPSVAYVLDAAAMPVVGGDAATAAALQAKLAETRRSAVFANAGGGTVTIPLPDGALTATCRDGRMTLLWK